MRLFAFFAALIFNVFAPPAMAFDAGCETPGYLAGFDARFVAQPCDEIGQVTIYAGGGTATMRFLRTATEWHGDDAYWLARAQDLADRVGRAMTDMGGLQIQSFVTVMIAPTGLVVDLHGSSANAHAATAGHDPVECRITFYKLPGEVNDDLIMFSLAHEIFHCIEGKTFASVMSGPDVRWWYEGAAEYFANLAVPDSRFRQDYVHQFDQASLTHRMIDLVYETQVFFFWVHNQSGPRGVSDLIHDLGAAGNGDALAIAQGAITPEEWTAFAEAYLFGDVTWPDGGDIAVPVAVRTHGTVPPDTEFSLQTDAFLLDRIMVQFERDNHFDITAPSATDGLTVRASIDTAGGWIEVPAAVDTCDGPRNYLIYAATTTGPTSAAYEVTDTDMGGGGCCLVGDWAPTIDTLQGLAQFGLEGGAADIAAVGGNMSCDYAGGDWTLTFGDDGTGVIAYHDNTTTCAVSMQGGEMETVATRNGDSEFSWATSRDAAGAGMAVYTGNSVNWSIDVNLGPVSQTINNADAGPNLSSNGFAYTCSPTDLSITGLYGVNHLEAAYTRLEPLE